MSLGHICLVPRDIRRECWIPCTALVLANELWVLGRAKVILNMEPSFYLQSFHNFKKNIHIEVKGQILEDTLKRTAFSLIKKNHPHLCQMGELLKFSTL